MAKRKKKPVDPAKIKKLWKLLALGLHDLRKHEQTRGCAVVMSTLLHTEGRICEACLAGAVLRHTFGVRDDRRVLLENWEGVLDLLRQGRVAAAARCLHGRNILFTPYTKLNREIVRYEDDPKLWWKLMRRLLRELKAADL